MPSVVDCCVNGILSKATMSQGLALETGEYHFFWIIRMLETKYDFAWIHGSIFLFSYVILKYIFLKF